MRNISKAQAAIKVRKAMTSLTTAIKAASPQERRVIQACMSELRDIENGLLSSRAISADETHMLDDESILADDGILDDGKGSLEDLGDGVLSDLDLEDEPMAVLDDAGPDLGFEDEDTLGFDDQALDTLDDDDDLALSSLDLAAAALKAAYEDDEDEEEEDDDDDEEEEEEEVEEASEEEEGDVLAASDEGGDDDSDDEDDDSGDSGDTEEILTEEELKALEREGLVESTVSARIAGVQARLRKLMANEEAPQSPRPTEANEAPDSPVGDVEDITSVLPDYAVVEEEDSEEHLSAAEYNAVWASFSPEEKAELRAAVEDGTLLSAKRMSKQAFRKMQRLAPKNRKRRKYRTQIQKTKGKGKKASVMLPGGKRKVVYKKFYTVTYDNKGKPLGSFWFATKKPNKQTLDNYKKEYGVKHPAALPVVDPKKKWKK